MNNKFKVAVLGCGRIADMYKKVFLNMSDSLKICYAIDKDIDRAKEFASNFQGCKAITSYKEIKHGDVDSVHVLTPHYLHKEHCLYFMNESINVLSEKPIATTLDDALELVNMSKKTNVKYGVIFQNRYSEGIQKLIELKNSGKLGKILGVWSHLAWHRPPSYYQCDWKGSWEKEGGGVVIDQAIHSIDLVRYVLNEDVKTIDGHISQRKLTSIEVEDEADALITFNSDTSYSFFACNYHVCNSPIRIEFAFENGVATFVGTEMTIKINGEEPIVVNSCYGINVEGKGYWGNYHETQVKEYYDCLKNDKEVPFKAEDATKTLEIVLGIYKSSRENRKLERSDFAVV
ncbi:MAG: Gfo/Idh/MocA family protein [Pleomorphochaeta sp.]